VNQFLLGREAGRSGSYILHRQITPWTTLDCLSRPSRYHTKTRTPPHRKGPSPDPSRKERVAPPKKVVRYRSTTTCMRKGIRMGFLERGGGRVGRVWTPAASIPPIALATSGSCGSLSCSFNSTCRALSGGTQLSYVHAVTLLDSPPAYSPLRTTESLYHG
jgi:hypothetical protein